MTSTATAENNRKHPPGLFVLFTTEMWERFGFYTMLAVFTLYLRNKDQGFGWDTAHAISVYSTYIMFLYATPLLGGWMADKYIGYRNAVTIGGLLMGTGYILLSLKSVTMLYLGLGCLCLGNGFFKPNVSTMLGNLYPEGSKNKDSAYNIFYLGINMGAFFAPILAEVVRARFGFSYAFVVAALGMLVSLIIFNSSKKATRSFDQLDEGEKELFMAVEGIDKHAVIHNPGKDEKGDNGIAPIEKVEPGRRIIALLVIYAVAIVFWMIFHQNGSTLTIWADENTAWNVSGIISNAINPFWIVTLTFPLLWFWKMLSNKGLEPGAPVKMLCGMLLTSLSFFIMYLAAVNGGDTGRVSPLWLIATYGVISLGELMLSPMALSLVSKAAPKHVRGLMMGGWFVATAIGNKLTAIGKYWDVWPHSKFFFLLSMLALGTAVLLFLILKPLKKALPGV